MITNYYPPFEIGGYEQLCRDVVLRLVSRGHQVEVLTSNRGVATHPDTPEPGIHRHLQLHIDFEAKVGAGWQFLTRRKRAEQFNRQVLQNRVVQFRPDVIFIWNLQGLPRSIATDAEALLHAGVAYWLAGYSPAEPDEYWNYWSHNANNHGVRWIKNVLSKPALARMRREGKPIRPQMNHVAVVSEFMRKKGIEEGVLPPQTQVIYNGVEVDDFFNPVAQELQGPLSLLQAGRVSADKGVHLAVEALGLLVRDAGVKQIHLNITGSGPAAYLDELTQLAKSFQIEDKITFTGWIPRQEMPALISRNHVLLLPTIHQEPFARVVLEAMACGLVVVGSRTGGTEELVAHGENGLLFSGTGVDLANQIKDLVSDPDLRVRLASCGQARVLQGFSLEHMVDSIECLLLKAVNAAHRTVDSRLTTVSHYPVS